jgi:hypothetical protein
MKRSSTFRSVPLIYLTAPVKQSYIDGSETFLNDFFDLPESEKQEEIANLFSLNPSWPIRYHLSPRRQALLNWYVFKKNATLLEVGAGCGALTGLFCRKLKLVYANELTPNRGKIIAKRYRDMKNLKVYIGNILSLPEDFKFEYVTAIGSLEYAGKYCYMSKESVCESYISFLAKLKSLLKKNGCLLLAIENKIGLKYLGGGKEDHYGDLFSSLENYPKYDGVRTFSKNELRQMLTDVGFRQITFFYPFPDYKLPNFVFSDEGLKNNNLSRSSFLRIIDFSNERFELYDEIALATELSKESIIDHFANSFLIEAKS